jgi:hypothetical protein
MVASAHFFLTICDLRTAYRWMSIWVGLFLLFGWLWDLKSAYGNGFARALGKDDREAFEAVMDSARNYASESSNATNPELFEP